MILNTLNLDYIMLDSAPVVLILASFMAGCLK